MLLLAGHQRPPCVATKAGQPYKRILKGVLKRSERIVGKNLPTLQFYIDTIAEGKR